MLMAGFQFSAAFNMIVNQAKKGIVLTFGELLLRIIMDKQGNWLGSKTAEICLGGAELNVAATLSLWELPARIFTALPGNSIGSQVMTILAGKGIDTSAVVQRGERMGLYFLEQDADIKKGDLIYDRKNSAFQALTAEDIDFDRLLQNVSWFHFTGITPALNAGSAGLCKLILKEVSRREIPISIDLNYRAKLWKYGKEPSEIMPDLIKYCNLIIGNIWALKEMVATEHILTDHIPTNKETNCELARSISAGVMEKFPACCMVANTFRLEDGPATLYYTTLCSGEGFYLSASYNSQLVREKVGSGDCFSAGLLYGIYNNWPVQEMLDYATAAAFTKMFIPGDSTNMTVNEITKCIKK
jgi:2-dehydro-3-deoxygluconokinase